MSICSLSAIIDSNSTILLSVTSSWFAVPERLTPLLGVLFPGWSCKGNDGPVTSLEGITVNPERKVREKWKQSGERQEIDENWQKQRGLDKPGCCDLQYNTTPYMSSGNNIFNLTGVWSTNKKTNLNNQGTQLSTHL